VSEHLKRAPAAEPLNAERADKPPEEPPSNPRIKVPDGYWMGSATGVIIRLQSENAALRAEIVRLLAEVARRGEKGVA
jgi:hypothetical protein